MATNPNTLPTTLEIPSGFKLILGLLVIGVGLQAIESFSKQGAYLLVILILLGYASMGGRLENVAKTLRSLGLSR